MFERFTEKAIRVIMLAQEESRSISENVTWGQRQSFRNGKVHVAYSTFLGFTKGEDGKLAIYYGAADCRTCVAFTTVDIVIDYIKKHDCLKK